MLSPCAGPFDNFCAVPLQNAYSIYAKTATFHDPIGIAEGVESIKAQFNGLAKVRTKRQFDERIIVWLTRMFSCFHARIFPGSASSRTQLRFPRVRSSSTRMLLTSGTLRLLLPPRWVYTVLTIERAIWLICVIIQTVNSLLTVETNDSHQVIRHTEEWDHKRETDRSDGFFGMLNENRKKLTAGITSMFVSSDPGKN